MSLESVFSVLAGWLVLHEVLSPRELTGCMLVFAAVILAQVPDMLNHSINEKGEKMKIYILSTGYYGGSCIVSWIRR